MLKVLVGCEESQRVCIAFREKGHEAYSCDIKNCSGGHPEWHIQEDLIKLLEYKWDLIIAHPPCTYLSNAGARWLYAGKKLNEDRYKLGLISREFFMKIYNSNCDRIAIENPVPSKIYNLPKCSQIIQPYYFGEPFSKKTCLWLKGLPNLVSTQIIYNYVPYCPSGSYSKSHDPKFKGDPFKGDRQEQRSKTFFGIAKAMANQWG